MSQYFGQGSYLNPNGTPGFLDIAGLKLIGIVPCADEGTPNPFTEPTIYTRVDFYATCRNYTRQYIYRVQNLYIHSIKKLWLNIRGSILNLEALEKRVVLSNLFFRKTEK